MKIKKSKGETIQILFEVVIGLISVAAGVHSLFVSDVPQVIYKLEDKNEEDK